MERSSLVQGGQLDETYDDEMTGRLGAWSVERGAIGRCILKGASLSLLIELIIKKPGDLGIHSPFLRGDRVRPRFQRRCRFCLGV